MAFGETTADAQPFVERRRTARGAQIHLRGRHGQVPHFERRHDRGPGFDIAAALELNLDSYPTAFALLTLLQTWLYAAEDNDLPLRCPDYVDSIRHAISVLEQVGTPVAAIAL